MKARLDSELLRTFVAVADTGGFTRASDVVYRTQSAISMQIKKLEEIVDKPLFIREARGAALTTAGEALLENARRILTLLDKTEKTFNKKRVAGIVRVGIPEEYGSTILPKVLETFSEDFPDIQVSVRCEPSESFPQCIDRGALDIAVVVCDPGDERGEILFHDPTVWATSKRHLAHEKTPIPLAVFEKGCLWRDWALSEMDRMARSYRIAYSSASVAGIQAAVLSGLSVAVLGQSTLPPGTRSLKRKEGFSRLPGSNITLQQKSGPQSDAIESMSLAIVEAFQT